ANRGASSRAIPTASIRVLMDSPVPVFCAGSGRAFQRRATMVAMRHACAVVLAGGESRRFGSDKALAQFRGEALISRVVRELAGAGFAQVALAAKDPDKYAAVAGGAELLHDVRPIRTPLAGLAAGLRASRYPLVFACAADMPFAADGALIDALIAAIADHDVAVPQAGGSLQPLCALWRREPCLKVAEE